MDEFLKQNYTLLIHSIEVIAGITGILYYKKYKDTTTKYFIWFLVYVAVLELIGSYPGYVVKYEFLKEAQTFLKDTKFAKNYWFFTIFWVIGASLFYGLYFRKNIKNHIFREIIKYVIIGFLIFSVGYLALNFELLFIGKIIPLDLFSVSIVMLSVTFYLIEMLRSDKVLRFYNSINFYIAVTLIIWYSIITPLSFYNMYFSTADWNFVLLKYRILLFSNIFMYLTFTLALIFCKPESEI